MMDHDSYCEDAVRIADRDRFLATLFAPAHYRAALFALYAFDADIAAIARRIREPLAGEVRLQWWHDTISGAGGEQAAASPLAAALLAAIESFNLPRESFFSLLEARRFDVYREPMASRHELEDYLEATVSTILDLAIRILNDGVDPQAGALTKDAGLAIGLSRMLTAFPSDVSQGLLLLPQDSVERHGANTEDILAGKNSLNLKSALAEIRNDARAHLDVARSQLPSVPGNIEPALLPLVLVGPRLRRMERSGYDPFRPDDVPAWRCQWLLWRASRNLAGSL